MKNPKFRFVVMMVALMLALVALAGCGGQGGDGGGMPADAALKITGKVDQEMGWTEDEVRGMDTIEAESTNKDGETKSYTGVPVNDLLDKAGVQDGASTLTFVADDGYTADAALDEVRACADCIVSFRNQGGFSMVLPGFPGNVQVKGVIEIQVK